MRKNKFIIMLMISLTLSLVMVLPTAIYAEEGIAHIDCTDSIEHIETELLLHPENEEISPLYGIICPFCDSGSITRTIIDPTCTTFGSKEISCSNCGYYDYTTINKIPHVYNSSNYYCYQIVRCGGCGKSSGEFGTLHRMDFDSSNQIWRCRDCTYTRR